MDKKRRDMKRNPESWWRKLYNEDGEVGEQAKMVREEYGLWDSLKFTFFGITK